MVYILRIQKIEDFSGTVSDISFNMDIPDSPCQKNIRMPPRIMPVKKPFFLFLKKEGHSPSLYDLNMYTCFIPERSQAKEISGLHLCHKLAVLSVPDLFHINFSAFAEIQKAFQIFSSYKDDHITIY
mgnify:CR=1 FL=1